MPKKTSQSPGEFLSHLLEKHKLNPFKLSKDIHLSQSAVRLIALGETRISIPVAMRLAKYFNTNPEFWLAMQMKWDLAEAAKDKNLVNIVKSISKFKRDPAAGKKAATKKPASNKAKIAKKLVARKNSQAKAGKRKPASAASKKTRKRAK